VSDFNLRFAIIRDDLLSSDHAITVGEGLNVVYGLNGAGKTRFLTGIRNAIQGVAGLGVALLVELPPPPQIHDLPSTLTTRFHQTAPLAVVAKALATTGDFDFFAPGAPLVERRMAENVANDVVDRYLSTLVPPEGTAHDWSSRHRLFLFVPAGRADAPMWRCSAVADPTEEWAISESLAAAALWQEYDDNYIYGDEDEDGHEEHEQWYRESKRALTLLPEEEATGFLDLRPFQSLSYGMVIPPDPIIVTGPVDFGVDLAPEFDTVDAATADYLRSRLTDDNEPWREEIDEGRVDPALEMVASREATTLSDAVTRRLQHALLDGPIAHLDLAVPRDRLFDSPFAWVFTRPGQGAPRVPLAALSRAERLWAERSIVEAAWELKEGGSGRPRLYLYDEPESALHRAGETHMATSLVERSKRLGVSIVAATHSPELLDVSSANLLEAKRSALKSILQPLGAVSREDLAGLGLNPSDLLRLTRVYLAVEGHHDEVLINYFLGERLRRARVEILPLRGGSKLPHTVDSRVLFDHTNAHLVGLLDNVDAEPLHRTWSDAQELAVTGHVAEAKDLILDRIGKASGEAQYLSAWLTRALDKGLESRLTPFGLSRPDIIEYLPVDKFVAGASSWNSLREQHARELSGKSGTPRDFKKWLTGRYKVSFGAEDLLRSADGVAVPKEFERLAKTVEAIATDRGSSLG